MGDPDVPFPGSDGTNLVGRRLGRYELLYEIASGGMAAVYLARSRGASGFERLVAVKVPHPHLRKDEEFAPMFLDEARLAAQIHHPNVVPVLDFGEAGALFLVMDYVEGNHLAALIRAAGRRGERLPPGVTLRILIDSLTGLHAAHELKDNSGTALNIVHRDTSPQNVLIGCDGISRITDFGIARAEARAAITRDGQVKGKLSYIAPEQLAGDTVTRRADVFGMGVLLWEALVGQRLFRADSEAETVNLLLSGEIKKPSEFVPTLKPVDEIVLKALQRNTEARYATAAEFADALENCGIKVASSRQVAACVEDLIGESLARRREEIKVLRASEASFRSLVPPSMGDSSGTPMALDDVSLRARRPGRAMQAGLAVALLVAAGMAFAAFRGDHGAHPGDDAAQRPASHGTTTASALPGAVAPLVLPTPVPPVAPPPVSPPIPSVDPTHSNVALPPRTGTSSVTAPGTAPPRRPATTRHRGHEFSPGTI